MPLKKRSPAEDALRDQATAILRRTPAHAWLKPDQVELKIRRVISRTGRKPFPERKTAADYRTISLGSQEAGTNESASPPASRVEMEFVLERPGSDFPSQVHRVRPHPDILEGFLELATASDQHIQKFASSFGALLMFGNIEKRRILPDKLVIVEACETWRYFARSMRSLLSIASCFHADRKSDPADWEQIGACPASLVAQTERHRDLLSLTSLSGEQAWLAMAHFVRRGADRDRKMWTRLLNVLLELGRVRPWLVWEGEGSAARPNLVFSSPNLLSYLALQLCLRASKHDAFAVCCYCNQPYAPLGRAPKTGQRNFCPDCRRRGVPLLLAQRSRRERLRANK